VTRETTAIDPRAIATRLEQRIGSYGEPRGLVAFSGGVDSSTVLALAARALGPELVTAITAVSPSYPAGELEEAMGVAQGIGVSHRIIHTSEVDREAYARNDGERCFHCKTELYATIGRLVGESRAERTVLMAGANADDAGDFRPGLRAGRQQGVRNPLLEEGLGKDDVRAIARLLELPVADKPALACLSSRVAFGIRITSDLLGRIDRAEQAVRDLGFDPVRVRHFGESATVEVMGSEVERLLAHPELPELRRILQTMGWQRVDVDLRGYRSGSMNETLSEPIPTKSG
jgi:uncharacterized protein